MSNITAPVTLSMDKVTYLLRPDEDGYPDVKMPKAFICVFADIKSFTYNTLTITSHFPGVNYEHDIVINEDHIQLTCSCGSTDFCFHIQGLLRHLVWKCGTDFFKQFRGFPFNDMEKYAKFFDVNYHHEKVIVKAKHEFGIIYNRGIRTMDAKPKFWTEPVPVIKDEHTQIGYTLGFVNSLFDYAFLIPYQAILTSDKTEIKGYRRFMDLADPQIGLSADQRLLNSYCEDFNKLIASETDHEIKKDEQALAALKEKNRHIAFGYWKKLVPLLMKQPYLHEYHFYKKIAYKLKPEKHSMLPITFSDEKVVFGLTLKEKKDHFKLSCHAYIKNKAFDIHHVLPPKAPFFFYLKKDHSVHYLFSNLKEAAIVNDFRYTEFALTILKEDLLQFSTNVLNEWAEEFPVTFKLSKKPAVMPLSVVQKQIIVIEKEGTVYFTPSIVYDQERTVNIFSNGSQMLDVDDENYVVLQRNKTAEKNFRTLFLKLSPAFEEMIDQRLFFLPMATFNDPVWLSELLRALKSEDISMLGLEDLTELNLDLSVPDVSIAVNADKDWFDITVAISYGNQSLSPEDIKKALKNSSKGLRLMNGKTAFLPDSFVKQLMPAFHNGQVTATGVKVAGRHYSLIDELFDSICHPDLRNVIEEHRKVFDLSDQIPVMEVPSNVNAVLRPYQVAGFSWMCHLHSFKWGGLLADDMGLGKTLQVLTLLQYLKNKKLNTGPHLLIAPTSLLFNWKEEAAKFCPDLKISTYYGLSRDRDLKRLMNYDLILTSYGTAMIDIEFLKDIPFDYLILDEAQSIKNPLSQRFKAMTMISAKYHLALTGTPVENSSTDLYALLSFANPGFFGSLKMFNDHMVSKGDEEDDLRNQELLKTINPFILRRTKDKVATDLPPKTEMVLWCEMEPAQRKIYDAYRKKFKDYIVEKIDAEGLENSKLYVLDGLMKLRQICNSPSLVKDAPHYDGESCKIDELMVHITEKTGEHKVLVFSQFTGMLQLIRERLVAEGIGHVYLDGKTAMDKRKDVVDCFQEDTSVRVFLISLKAGGSGLNLTAADYVYLVDPWWNPAAESQAIDRCYRIGQDKHVMAYRMICKDTLEEKILAIQQKKRKLAGDLIPTDDGVLKSMSKEDILKLFG